MSKKKKICVVAASAVIVAPMLFTTPASASSVSNGILSKIERQLSVNKILKDIERLSMEDGQNKDNARVTGFEGEHEAAKYIQSQFKKLGLNSELKTVDGIDGFIDEGSSLTINNQSVTVKTLTYSQPTNQKLEGELVYAKTGTENECKEANLRGKIALIQRGTISFADKAKNAYNNGAIGVIIYNNASGMLNGTLGELNDSVVPTVGMSLEDGKVLVDKVNAGESVNVSMEVNTIVKPNSFSYNVVGELPAHKNVKNPQTLVVGAHFDSVSCPGANDNASGTATILELARLISQPEVKNKLQYNIKFVAFGAEEIGLVGSKEYVEQLVQSGESQNIAGMINLDMVGVGNQVVTYNIDDNSSHKITDIAHENINELGYKFGGHFNSGSSDHAPFEAAGIPSVFIQFDKDPYYHTDEDTLDKIDPQNIKETATLVLNMLMDMQEKSPNKPNKPNKKQFKNIEFENEEMPSL